jgi:hypothetical protein
MSESVLVSTRSKAIRVSSLGVSCDDKEIPTLIDGAPPQGWWIVGECTFAGSFASDEPETPTTGSFAGMAAVAVSDEKFVGIMSPSGSGPALWWAWPLSASTVEVHGSQGIVKKRPGKLAVHRAGGVDADGDSVVLHIVGRLYPSMGSVQSKQEASLLNALGGQ